MEYDHSRKAGNRGDVWKHSLLLELADVLPTRSGVFKYVESHSGSPVHELRPGGEWERGVRSIVRETAARDSEYAAAARDWLRAKRYPASWLFVANRIGKRFTSAHISLSDVADRVAASYPLTDNLRVPSNVAVEFRQTDGFGLVADLESADLVFLDPPFNPVANDDWRRLAGACQQLAQRAVPFVAWYPVYWPSRPQWLADTTLCSGWEVSWATFGPKPSQNLKGCGMLASESIVPLLREAEQDLRRIATGLRSEFRIRQPKTV
jgi:23S rRNA A2030 N6-methylase RlmJ